MNPDNLCTLERQKALQYWTKIYHQDSCFLLALFFFNNWEILAIRVHQTRTFHKHWSHLDKYIKHQCETRRGKKKKKSATASSKHKSLSNSIKKKKSISHRWKSLQFSRDPLSLCSSPCHFLAGKNVPQDIKRRLRSSNFNIPLIQ